MFRFPSLFSRPEPFFTFDAAALEAKALQYKEEYAAAAPFSHCVIDDFLPARAAEKLLGVFPKPDSPFWFDWKTRDTIHQPKKQGIGNATRLEGADPFIHNILYAFNSYPFIHFLETLTSISGLMPDPHFHGGGLHQILRGGKLAVHCDFNYEEHIKLYRRINVLLYLNKDWEDSYNGCLELWDKDLTACQKSIKPIFNRCVIFNTDRYSFHGHPKELLCPEDRTRKSVALYYYSREAHAGQTETYKTLWDDAVKNGTNQ